MRDLRRNQWFQGGRTAPRRHHVEGPPSEGDHHETSPWTHRRHRCRAGPHRRRHGRHRRRSTALPFTEHIDETFPSRTSEACGFDILLHLEGTMRFTDFSTGTGSVPHPRDVPRPLLHLHQRRHRRLGHLTQPGPGALHVEPGRQLHRRGHRLGHEHRRPGQRAIQAGHFVVTVDANGDGSESEPVGRNDDYHAALCDMLAP